MSRRHRDANAKRPSQQRALSVEEAASAVGMTATHLRGYLEGHRQVTPWLARAIARELSTEPEWPLQEDDGALPELRSAHRGARGRPITLEPVQ